MDGPLNKQKNSYQKYGRIFPLSDIAAVAMAAAAELEKHNNQAYMTLV